MTDFSEAYELISKEELSDIGSTGYLYYPMMTRF